MVPDVRFFELPEPHGDFVRTVEAKLRLFQTPPKTEAEILATVTSFSPLKPEGLARLLNDLALKPTDRQRVLVMLLDVFRDVLDARYESARVSQARVIAEMWADWSKQAR